MLFFFFKQKTAYDMRISDWSSDVCSSDLIMNTETSNSPETRRNDLLALGARVLIAPIFVISGAAKLADPAGTIGYIGSVGLPFAEAGYAATVAVELIGGLALLVGFKTRIAALALARSEEHTSELQSLMRISYAV